MIKAKPMPLPYKINKKMEALNIVLLIAMAILSFYFYRRFPAQVATHFDVSGQPDGYSGKTFAAFFFPLVFVGIYLLMLLLPFADPQRKRYQEFGQVYQLVRLSINVFFFGVYLLVGLNGIGYAVPIGLIMPAGVGLLFIILGNVLPKVKRNWFVGIRTPWTLSSETVWYQTHRLSGKLFVASGLLLILSIWLPKNWQMPLLFTIIAAILILTTGYSWWLWRQAEKKSIQE